MMRRGIVLAAPLLLALAFVGPARADDPALWALLRDAGQVVLMRHSQTEPGVGDPEGMVLGNCRTQRNLSDAGRLQARQVGVAFRERGIVISELLSSPWCRCLETARLAFGKEPQASSALGNLFGRSSAQSRQVQEMKPLVSTKPASGNRVLVSHGSTILALTGVSLEPGEMLVVTPQGAGKFAVAGRLEVAAR